MLINGKETKTIIFNYTNKYQFTTRLTLDGQNVEVIDSTKLLGTIISNDLKWSLNTAVIVKKANARMELLRKVSSFGASVEDLKTIYTLFVRSLLEQSATVWHSSLTQENIEDLERVQRSALKVILKDNYESYQKALTFLDMKTLKERREELCLSFALKCLKHPKSNDMFPLNDKPNIETRNQEKFSVQHAYTDRLKNSGIIYMQNLLNQHEQEKTQKM